MERPDRAELEAIRNLVQQAEQYCLEAAATRRHVEARMRQTPFWPERRQPRRWSEGLGCADDADLTT